VGDGGGEHGPAAEEIKHAIDGAWAEVLRLGPATLPDTATLTDRLRAACEQILAVKPEGLRGSRLDPDVTGKRRAKLCARVEGLIGPEEEAPRERSPQELALALRERLAANTIAGKQVPRQQDTEQELEQIAASWARLGPVLGEDARALAARFERARARVTTIREEEEQC
jgi:hypothetical protein